MSSAELDQFKSLIPLFKVTMSPHAGDEVQKTLQSGFIGQGQKVEEFEELLQQTFGWQNALTVNSGTSALQLALHLLKTCEGEEVLLPPLSCFATTTAVLANRMTPRWVDINPNTLIMDLDDLACKLTKNTKIILLVHFAGRTPDYGYLNYILEEHENKYCFKPYVIEDCAQSLGSCTSLSVNTGNTGHVSCFSFQAVKSLTTGDGGALVLPSHLYEKAKLLRWYGFNRARSIKRQNVQEAGFKYHMNDISATIGISNLKYVEEQEYFSIQMERYEQYLEEFGSYDYGMPNNGQYPVLVEDINYHSKVMKESGVESFTAHYRCDKHECVKQFQSNLPGMDFIENRMTMIPCGWWVPEEKILEIIHLSKKCKIKKNDWEKCGF